LADEKFAKMTWLKNHLETRKDPSRLLAGCRAIISLAYPYPPEKPFTKDGFSIARYANPKSLDYHQRLKAICRPLMSTLENKYPGSRSRICIDSAPLIEKSWAMQAGLGFIGKNNLLIIPGYGSYLYLAEIVTTAPLEFQDMEPMKSQCGSCTQCLDACPTGALEGPYCLDAAKCLSYLTIEDREPLPADLAEKAGNCFFGCDRCQEACPFNPPQGSLQRIVLPPTDTFLNMDSEMFEDQYGKSALARAGLEKIKATILAIKHS
jgi:epoxyqueuosine reductase